MKTRLLKISMLATVLMFLFAGASWADRDRGRHRDSRPAKRIEAKHHRGRDHHRPARYRHKIKRYRKHFYRHHHRHHYRKRPALRYWRHHRFYHRHKWIRRHRPDYRHDRFYSENSYEDDAPDAPFNEFSIAATISEPGVEFTIGTKRTW